MGTWKGMRCRTQPWQLPDLAVSWCLRWAPLERTQVLSELWAWQFTYHLSTSAEKGFIQGKFCIERLLLVRRVCFEQCVLELWGCPALILLPIQRFGQYVVCNALCWHHCVRTLLQSRVSLRMRKKHWLWDFWPGIQFFLSKDEEETYAILWSHSTFEFRSTQLGQTVLWRNYFSLQWY